MVKPYCLQNEGTNKKFTFKKKVIKNLVLKFVEIYL